MFNPFQKVGQINEMRKQAMEIQKQLQAEEVIVDKNGVRIVISGDQKIKELLSNGKSDNDVKDAVNEAIKKSQEVAAKKLSQMGGGLGGLLGGMGGQ
ncbi:MAG: YbaB/EbfC family nucleoid-associated protein [Candidatus Levybacteria bacterium]|nr:YbaB/EbfC family nucleoid-associated protein [Candidatus Levybacteria bacterium]